MDKVATTFELADQLKAKVATLVANNKQHTKLQADYDSLSAEHRILLTKYEDIVKANSKLAEILAEISTMVGQGDTSKANKAVLPEDAKSLFAKCEGLWHGLPKEERNAIYCEILKKPGNDFSMDTTKPGAFYENYARMAHKDTKDFWNLIITRYH